MRRFVQRDRAGLQPMTPMEITWPAVTGERPETANPLKIAIRQAGAGTMPALASNENTHTRTRAVSTTTWRLWLAQKAYERVMVLQHRSALVLSSCTSSCARLRALSHPLCSTFLIAPDPTTLPDLYFLRQSDPVAATTRSSLEVVQDA